MVESKIFKDCKVCKSEKMAHFKEGIFYRCGKCGYKHIIRGLL